MPKKKAAPKPPPTEAPRRLERMTHEKIVSTARGIVTGDLLIADLDDRDWVHSLTLLVSGWSPVPENVGLILVPVGPHMGGLWLNGRVPGCTTSAQVVAEEDRELVRAEVERMHAALYPEGDDE